MILGPLKDVEAALKLFSRCFFHDPYYSGHYSSEMAMGDDFRECFEWTLENGRNTGAFEKGELVGMAMTFPLSKLDGRMFGEFFGDSGILHDMAKANLDHVYLFAICVVEERRGQGIGGALFDSVIEPGVKYIGDVTNGVSLKMCVKRGFKTERMGEESYWHRVSK